MFVSIRQKHRTVSTAKIDITPLIDVVFLLLVFLLMTAAFIRDTGIEVTAPLAGAVDRLNTKSLRIVITSSGSIYCEGEQIQLSKLSDRIKQFVDIESSGTIIMVPDHKVFAGRLVAIMDIAKQVGAADIALAADPLERE